MPPRDNGLDASPEAGWMRRALELAHTTHPHPNPRVGALVVDSSGSIVAEAAHASAGEPHAEALAVASAGVRARGSTVVVTLEPCHHHGRTPPCTQALIDAGVARVVVGAGDPDRRVAGRGVAALRGAGIDVVEGIEAAEVEAMDRGYFHHRRTGRPRFTLKAASTIDGQVAPQDGRSRWITSLEARRDGHRLRARSDAVMVGAGTVRADDPRLDVRLDGYTGPQPRPVVVAGSGELPAGSAVFARRPIVYAPRELTPRGDRELVVAPAPAGVDLETMAKDLGERDILDVLIEGGPTLAGAMWQAGLIDAMVVYLAAKVAGGGGLGMFSGTWPTLGAARDVKIIDVVRLGPDVRIDAEVQN